MRDPSSFPERDTTRGNKITSSRRAVSVGQKRQWMNERVSFEIKRKSPPAPPFSSLHQSQLYPLSPLLSFIITARDFIPALEAVGRPARCSARKKEEEERRWTCSESETQRAIDFWHRDYCKTPCSYGGGISRGQKKVSNPPVVVPISSRKRKQSRHLF